MKTLICLLFLFFIVAPALAHEGGHITYADLGGEPMVIPSHPLYVLKELRRAINRVFALGTEQKIEVELKIAKERLAEIKKLAEENPEHTDAINRAEARYRAHFETMRAHFAELSDTNKNAGRLIEKLGEIAERHFLVFEEVRERTGQDTDEREATENAISKVAEEAIRIDKEKTKQVFRILWEKENRREATTTVEILLEEFEDLHEEKIGTRPPIKEEPSACIQVYDPVCGVDGKTYSNSCFAGLVKVAIMQRGECTRESQSSQTGSPQKDNIPPPTVTPPTTPAPVSKTIGTSIASFAFEKEIRIKAGDAVRWTNADSVGHTVTSENGIFDSNLISSGQSFSFTFREKGSFPYFCQPHPFMRGTVVVE